MLTKVEEVEKNMKGFLSRQFLFEFDEMNITSTTDLFTSGLIDSFGCIELVSFIESQYKIKLADDELLSGSLKSLDSIVKLIRKKIKDVS